MCPSHRREGGYAEALIGSARAGPLDDPTSTSSCHRVAMQERLRRPRRDPGAVGGGARPPPSEAAAPPSTAAGCGHEERGGLGRGGAVRSREARLQGTHGGAKIVARGRGARGGGATRRHGGFPLLAQSFVEGEARHRRRGGPPSPHRRVRGGTQGDPQPQRQHVGRLLGGGPRAVGAGGALRGGAFVGGTVRARDHPSPAPGSASARSQPALSGVGLPVRGHRREPARGCRRLARASACHSASGRRVLRATAGIPISSVDACQPCGRGKV